MRLNVVDHGGLKVPRRPVKHSDARPVIGSFYREKRHNDLQRMRDGGGRNSWGRGGDVNSVDASPAE